MLDRDSSRRAAVAHRKFAEDGTQMCMHGSAAKKQRISDIRIAQATGYEAQDLQLPWRQLFQTRRNRHIISPLLSPRVAGR